MKVSNCMTIDAQIEHTICEAAQIMASLDAGVMPVGDGDRLVGMLSDRDIAIRGIALGRDLTRRSVTCSLVGATRRVLLSQAALASKAPQSAVLHSLLTDLERQLVAALPLSGWVRLH